MIEVIQCTRQNEWDKFVQDQGGHPLQLWGWGEVKAAHGWSVQRFFVKEQGVCIGALSALVKQLPRPFPPFIYIARGPVCDSSQQQKVLDAFYGFIKGQGRALAVSVEPDTETGKGIVGWKKSKNTILIPETLILDLEKDNEALLVEMTKKTRQYIRKSEKDGVLVRQAETHEDIEKCLAIYKETATRAHFALHDDAYYYDIFDKMGDCSPVYMAVVNGEIVSFLWLAKSKKTAFELYGGVSDLGQKTRANYILKWQAIQHMRQDGATRYDMNGLLNDGVSSFKQGFAAHNNRLDGTYSKGISPLFFVWETLLPFAKKIYRKLRSR